MPDIFQIESGILLVASFALLAVKIFALVTSLMFSTEHYRAADKLSKPAWVAILALSVAASLLFRDPINLINLAFTVATFVYLADVRPAMTGLRQR